MLCLTFVDTFVLNYSNGQIQYIWLGKGANFIERKVAGITASFLAEIDGGVNNKWTVHQMEEGGESNGFWELLGGKGEYANDDELQEVIKLQESFNKYLLTNLLFNFVGRPRTSSLSLYKCNWCISSRRSL
jgi:hypothetical protein